YVISYISHLHAQQFTLVHFLFNRPATPAIYTLSLHDALPISCMVISARYCSGVMRPPSKNGSLAFGQARWMRISSERNIPTKTESTANKMYWMPMILWSKLKMYFQMKAVGG